MVKPQTLGQLLLMQSIVIGLPDEKEIFSFICHGLLDIPGVAAVYYSDAKKQSENEPSTIRLPLQIGETCRGALYFAVTNADLFDPYLDYLKNFCFMLTVILEERRQRRQNERFQAQLEERVLERTTQLEEQIKVSKEAMEGLVKAKTEAEEANRVKDQFIAVLSHELRTPLSPVFMLANELAGNQNVPQDIRADMEMIRRNVELEIKLIDDLLDMTRIRRGIIHLHQEVVNVHASLRHAWEICHGEIEARHLNFSLKLEATEPHVWADPVRLQQVFLNLLRNAVKFTPERGAITIRSVNQEGLLRLEFTDTGIGIEPDLMPRIFNAFEQGEQGKIRRFGGLGLGLHIARQIMELHHGRLIARSEGAGKGATFILELATIPDTELITPRPVASLLPQICSKRILLVDDHADTLRVLSKIFRSWGYEVRTADSVRNALKEAMKEPFDLLVSDIGLPDGSGLEIMKQVKKLYGVGGFAISGFGTEEDIRQSLAAGFDAHFVKPVSPQNLRESFEGKL